MRYDEGVRYRDLWPIRMPSGSFELRQALQPILGHSAHYHQFECLSEGGGGRGGGGGGAGGGGGGGVGGGSNMEDGAK